MSQIRLSPDGSTITVLLPIAWSRRVGRKVIVAPPGCDDGAPVPKKGNTLVKALNTRAPVAAHAGGSSRTIR